MPDLRLDTVLSRVVEIAEEEGELEEEATLLSVLEYLSTAGLPGAGDCLKREFKLQFPDAKIPTAIPDEVAGMTADMLE